MPLLAALAVAVPAGASVLPSYLTIPSRYVPEPFCPPSTFTPPGRSAPATYISYEIAYGAENAKFRAVTMTSLTPPAEQQRRAGGSRPIPRPASSSRSQVALRLLNGELRTRHGPRSWRPSHPRVLRTAVTLLNRAFTPLRGSDRWPAIRIQSIRVLCHRVSTNGGEGDPARTVREVEPDVAVPRRRVGRVLSGAVDPSVDAYRFVAGVTSDLSRQGRSVAHGSLHRTEGSDFAPSPRRAHIHLTYLTRLSELPARV